MNQSRFFYLALLIAFLMLVIYTFWSPSAPAQDEVYLKKVEQKREEKIKFLTHDQQSPIKNKEILKSLNYFKPDKRFLIKAKIERLEEPTTLSISLSTGESKNYIRFAKAKFQWEGKLYQLTLFKTALQDPVVFIPFKDLTNNQSTYGAGRYMDVVVPKNALHIDLDFNLAYNPFCAYNDNFACPLPPVENHLNFAVEAGEKNIQTK